MLLVDDHLARVALSAAAPLQWHGRVPSVTWVFYMRLAAATLGSNASGQHSRHRTPALIDAVKQPHPRLLRILDSRGHVELIADCNSRPGISLAAAELLAAAIDSIGDMHVAERNFTDAWRECLRGSGVSVTTYSADELISARPS